MFGELSWPVTLLTVFYSLAGLGIAIVNGKSRVFIACNKLFTNGRIFQTSSRLRETESWGFSLSLLLLESTLQSGLLLAPSISLNSRWQHTYSASERRPMRWCFWDLSLRRCSSSSSFSSLTPSPMTSSTRQQPSPFWSLVFLRRLLLSEITVLSNVLGVEGCVIRKIGVLQRFAIILCHLRYGAWCMLIKYVQTTAPAASFLHM